MKPRSVRRKSVVTAFFEGATEGMSERSVLTLGLVLLVAAIILSLIMVWFFSVSCSQSGPQGQFISDTPTPTITIVPIRTLTPNPTATITITPTQTPTPRSDGCG